MSLLEQLNEQQLAAVTCIDQHVRIIAGAGSGKTRVITARIAYLIEKCQVMPYRILAITFTNKASNEMKERVKYMLEESAAAVNISTIHSFCVRLLREDIYQIKYPRNFTILDSDDQKSILRDAYKQLNIDVMTYRYTNMISYISNHKIHFVDVSSAKVAAKDNTAEKVKADVYEFYQSRLKEMYALDFDDLLIYTYNLLKEHTEIRQKWQKRYTYIHVDEFQDVDVLQYAIIKLIMSANSYLCVVGDPDQTIYTWRGAKIDIIMNFEKDFKNAKTIILNENYRSTQPILHAANALIQNNKNRVEKALFTQNKSEDKIIHFTALDDYNEPVWVASKLLTLYRSGISYKHMAVLYRSNYLSRGLEKALLEFHIPYRIYGGVRFYDRAEIKDALSYLRLLSRTDETDPKALYKDLAIKRIINAPKRGIGTKTMEALQQRAQELECNLYDALKADIGKGKAKANIAEFVRVIEACAALVDEISIDQLLHKVLQDSGYLTMLEENKEIERLENIKELIVDITNYIESHPEGGLVDYLQEITLYSEFNEQGQGEYVQLMSIHAAKGLEFDYVFVYSLCEGVFPNEKSICEGGQSALEEERRLAYVAFTRAKKQLFLSDSYGYSYVLDKLKTTSRFISELPEEYLLDVGTKVKNKFYEGEDTFNSRSFTSSKSDEHKQTVDDNQDPPKKRVKIRKGDLVTHEIFGDGVVIKMEETLATIAFDKKFGIRKIMSKHPSLTKK